MKEKSIDTERVVKYLDGDFCADDQLYVQDLFVEGEKNFVLNQFVSNDWNSFLINSGSQCKDLTYILDRIHHKINLAAAAKTKSAGRKIYAWYSSAAAAILLPVLALSVYLYLQNEKSAAPAHEEPVFSQIYAPMMSRMQFTLPDGTTGWLNSNSTLEYSIPFTNNRNIKLTGEAWLDVAHDAKHPFSIAAKGAAIKVLGTRLNINAYFDENYLEVVLEEGQVEFTTAGGKQKALMQPSEKIIYKNGEIAGYEKTDAEKYTLWKEGKLVFRGDPMEEVARRIERWYNVKVIIGDDVLKTYSFRATFDDDSLHELLKLLSMTSPIDYKIVERELHSDGTYDKAVIILSKRKT